MVLQVPTASDLKERYPEFTGVANGTVTAIIAEASGMVDEDWVTTDQKPAIMAFAAHLLSMEGYPNRTNVQAPLKPGVGREVLARKVGDVSTQYAQTTSAAGSSSGLLSQLGLTPYGRRFAQLLKLNAPAIGLV